MFGLGFTEILVICLVVLIVFGPERLPGIARTLGQTASQLRRSVDEFKYELLSAPTEEEKIPPVLASHTKGAITPAQGEKAVPVTEVRAESTEQKVKPEST